MKRFKKETLEEVELGSSDEDSDSSEEEESIPCDAEEFPPTPPDYGYPDDGEWPPFVLIDQQVYYADHHNATTATVTAAEGSKLKGSIQVTFCPVAPPLVSYLCFHAPDMDYTKFAVKPHIITTETDGVLVLLRVIVGHSSDTVLTTNREYFVYNARAAKLDHLPRPGRQHEFNDYTLAIVRKCNQYCERTTSSSSRHHHDSGGFTLRPCHLAPHGHGHGQGAARQLHHHDCIYVVVAQALRFGGPKTSHLCMYHSHTQTWSKKPVVVASSYQRNLITSKTLNIGGDKGTVAWVDLRQSIVFCDVLDNQPMLRFLKLPKPITAKKTVGFVDPRTARDIAVVGNFIKFVDMHVHFDRSSKTSRRWKAATWSITTGSLSPEDWIMDSHINSTQIPPQPSLLRELKVCACMKAADPTMSTLHVGLPNLSLQNDAIVYLLAKIDYRDSRHTAWVLALDMKNMTVKEVHPFNAKRTLGLARGYSASRISAYLKPALDPNEYRNDKGWRC